MTLKFPGAWRFKLPPDGQFVNTSIPADAVGECIELIMKVTTQGERQDMLEHFTGHFCAAVGASHAWSSSASWAESDLWTFAREAAANAPLFIEAFYEACKSLSGDNDELWAPDAQIINELLARNGIGYLLRPPRLELREEAAPTVSVPQPPPTLTERAASILHDSLARSEQLLSEGRGREAVQESLWLLETVATAFRGLETTSGTVEGKYFTQIVRDLRALDAERTLKRVLDWVSNLHGYLSSPTGGGVRHGLDPNEGVEINENEARLFCNLIRSYLFYLLLEHRRLANSNQG